MTAKAFAWDTSPTLHPTVVQADPKAVFNRFGGEGPGAHTHLDYNWLRQMYHEEQNVLRYPKERIAKAAAYCATGYDCIWAGKPGVPEFRHLRLQAASLFERAHAFIPGSSIPYLGLGILNIELGNKGEGYRYLRMSAERGNKEARAELESQKAEIASGRLRRPSQ